MMLTGGKLRVIRVTTHCPLSEVASMVSKDKVFNKIMLINRELPKWGVKKPRIAVAALNPHAGEDNMLGTQETESINPAVKDAREAGVDVYGALPADTLFYKAIQGEFDVVLVMYHDQGLIPLKMAAFNEAVNITLGLPIIRTSVGHGCAWDIAGCGLADPSSLREAVKHAACAAGL